jgi:hypothetical protein
MSPSKKTTTGTKSRFGPCCLRRISYGNHISITMTRVMMTAMTMMMISVSTDLRCVILSQEQRIIIPITLLRSHNHHQINSHSISNPHSVSRACSATPTASSFPTEAVCTTRSFDPAKLVPSTNRPSCAFREVRSCRPITCRVSCTP